MLHRFCCHRYLCCAERIYRKICSLSCAARPLDAVGSRRSFHCAYKQSRKRATTNQTATKMIQRIPVSRPFDNEGSSFWAGIHQHRDRRLAYRQRQQQADTTENENRDADFSQLPSFNCYDVMYTGTIQMGTPSQSFNVKLDTSTSISWLPSERCDQTCRYLHIPKYNPYTSSTFKSIDASLPSEFLEKYPNEENSISIGGTFIQDTIYFGNNVSVSDYIFAEVTNYDYIPKCHGEGGRLGLGLSSSLPTETIWDRMTLKHPMFSVYLNPGNDYLSQGTLPDDIEHGSEFILGGVDSQHYKGCLHWHPPSNIPGSEHSWNVGLRSISVTQEDNNGIASTSSIDFNGFVKFDTGNHAIMGHPETISKLAAILGLECFNLGLDEEGMFPIDCGDRYGFDLASLDCNSGLSPIDFVLEDGTKYQLLHDDLMSNADMEWNGVMCFASILSDPDAERNSFSFGQVFLHRHYVAFNVDTKSIGLAESIAHNIDPTTNQVYERCDADYPFDIAFYTNELSTVPGMNDSNNPTDATPAVSNIAILMHDVKTWSSKNTSMMIAVTTGSFVSILILVLTILTCRRIYRHRNYKRADRDETTMPSKPNDADETELPDLI